MMPADPTREDLAQQWTELVKAEAKRCGHALLGLLHAKQKNPALWEAVHAPERVEAREAAAKYEQQSIDRIERQR